MSLSFTSDCLMCGCLFGHWDVCVCVWSGGGAQCRVKERRVGDRNGDAVEVHRKGTFPLTPLNTPVGGPDIQTRWKVGEVALLVPSRRSVTIYVGHQWSVPRTQKRHGP